MINKTYFIADIAANHDGDIERAKKLCELAKEAGADAAKFQHFKAKTIVNDYGFKKLGGQSSHQAKWKKSVYETYNDASVPIDWTPILKDHCDKIGIDFFTTPYDLDYIEELDDYVQMYKIGSGDITWLDMLNKVASKGKPVIIASGASEIYEVIRAIETLLKHKIPIILMQCNTNYTVDKKNFKYINLNVLKTYSVLFPEVQLGLSDHTYGDETVLGAVALGARYIEKHFTDDNNRDGPDHPFSMNPMTWKKMVERTRVLELSLGSSIKKVEENEKDTIVLQRRSIRLKKSMKRGDEIKESDISYLRPCPIDALPLHIIPIGRKLKRDIKADEYLKENDLQ